MPASTVVIGRDERRLAREPRARRLRPLREDVPAGRLERVERGKAAAREERRPRGRAGRRSARAARRRREQLRRALRLEAQQLAQLGARPVERRLAEAAPVLRRQVDAPELEVARHVLEEVHELEPGADRVARRDELGVVEPPQHAEHEPADRIGRVDAVLAQVVPGLVLGDRADPSG